MKPKDDNHKMDPELNELWEEGLSPGAGRRLRERVLNLSKPDAPERLKRRLMSISDPSHVSHRPLSGLIPVWRYRLAPAAFLFIIAAGYFALRTGAGRVESGAMKEARLDQCMESIVSDEPTFDLFDKDILVLEGISR